jgi:hypothetical protein
MKTRSASINHRAPENKPAIHLGFIKNKYPLKGGLLHARAEYIPRLAGSSPLLNRCDDKENGKLFFNDSLIAVGTSRSFINTDVAATLLPRRASREDFILQFVFNLLYTFSVFDNFFNSFLAVFSSNPTFNYYVLVGNAKIDLRQYAAKVFIGSDFVIERFCNVCVSGLCAISFGLWRRFLKDRIGKHAD